MYKSLRQYVESDAPFTIGLNSDYNISFANELIDFLLLSRNIDKNVLYMQIKINFKNLLS